MTHRPHQLRWLVRQEPTRQLRFGETRRDVTAWAVREYFETGDIQADGTPARVINRTATFFAGRTAAFTYARRECARRHGLPEPTRLPIPKPPRIR